MLRFLQTDFLSNYAIHVEWEFLQTPDSEATWSLQRSESPKGPFEDVSPQLKQVTWIDDITNKFSNYRTLYYRVLLDDTPSSIHSVKPDESTYIRNHIVWRNNLFLRRFAGSPMAVLVKRTIGDRCPDCYDSITGRSMQSKCATCFDTTFVDGYYEPILVFGQVDPQMEVSEKDLLGKKESHQSFIWISNYPYVNTDDLLFDYVGRGRIWRIAKISRTEHLRSSIRQMCIVEELRKDSIEYSLNIPPKDECSSVNIFIEEF